MCVGGHAVDCSIGDDDFVDSGKDDGATEERDQNPIDLSQKFPGLGGGDGSRSHGLIESAEEVGSDIVCVDVLVFTLQVFVVAGWIRLGDLFALWVALLLWLVVEIHG